MVLDCLCDFKANSLITMKRHRVNCEIWKVRDKNKIRLERQVQTYQNKYGVSNAMQIKKSRKKRQQTCLEKYGDKSELGKNSNIFNKVQKNNRDNKKK